MVSRTMEYTRGQIIHLDDIYDFQVIGSLNWWEPINEEGGDRIIISRDIVITFHENKCKDGVEGQINWKIKEKEGGY